MPIQLVLTPRRRVGGGGGGGGGGGVEEVGGVVLAELSFHFFAHEMDGQFGGFVLVAIEGGSKC